MKELTIFSDPSPNMEIFKELTIFVDLSPDMETDI
jgi:hypothetical protein